MNTNNQNNSDDTIPEENIQVLTYKLVILGDIAVGKSSIAQRFVYGKFGTLHEPTIGALFLTKKVQIPNYIAKFEIWDTAGQERYHPLIPMYYRNAHAAVIAFDITNYNSFEKAKKWVNELLEKANSGIVISLCGNKVDLEENRVVTVEEVNEYAESIGSFYTEVSAKQNINIEKIFKDIANKLPKKMPENDNIILNQNKEDKSDSMCRC